MSEAASHAEMAERVSEAIEKFEEPRSVALSCVGKDRHAIHLLLLDCANVVAERQGLPKDGQFATNRALSYAASAIEWLWTHTEQASLEAIGQERLDV